MSGYSIRITAFLPCGKNAAEHNIAFQKIDALHDALSDIGFVEVDVIDEYKPNRKSASQVSPSSAGGVAVDLPATQEAPESGQAPQPADSGADLEMPGFLKRG